MKDAPADSAKEAALELVRRLPDDCTWDEILYRLFVRRKIDAGFEDVAEGRMTPQAEVFEELEQRFSCG